MEDAIRQSALFARLDDDAAEELRAAMSQVGVRRGERVFAAGEPGDSVYVVVSGQVKVVRDNADGRETVLAVLGVGRLFGELSVIDLGVRDASVWALSDVVLLRLSHDDVNRWLDERPVWTMILMGQLARRLRRANDVVGDLVFADVPARVARTLIDLAEQFGVDAEPAGSGLRVQHGLTQTDLASLVGAARETVNKSLASFVARGWIRLESRSLVIMDRSALEHHAR